MEFDAYSHCPGGTGKKIKHCACRDIIGELEKIIRAIEGDQRIAALDRINRALATRAHRPCLLALKIMTLLTMKDLQSLEDTVTTFVKVAPDNVLAHTFAAMLESRKHRVREAVDELQTALSLVKEILPGEICVAFDEVAEGLAASGHYLAARAHAMLRLALDPDDEEANRPLAALMQAASVPLLMKRGLQFERCPDGATWKGRFEAAYREVQKGIWQKGRDKFERLNQDFPDQPAILWNLALARSCLAMPRLSGAWHAYAMCPGVEFERAVEAESLAQILSSGADEATVAFVKWTVHVQDANALNERMLSSKLLSPVRGDLSQFGTQDMPPPKNAFMLLDKPQPEPGVELTRDNVPRLLTPVALFGRETDRPARVEMKVPKTETMQQVRTQLAEIAGDLLMSEESEEILEMVPRLHLVLSPQTACPPGTPLPVRRRVMEQEIQHALLEQWPGIPLAALDDKSPRDVAADPAYRVQLAAALVVLEQVAEVNRWPIDVDALRQQLAVPVPEPIEPQAVDILSLAPPDWVRVVPERLTDEMLLQLHEHAAVLGGRRAAQRLGEEILRRESLADKVDCALLHAGLAAMTTDTDKALDHLQEAKKIAASKKRSPAKFLLSELPLRLLRGDAEETRALILRLQMHHLQEPGVPETLYNILLRFGVITPEGSPRVPSESPDVEDEPAPPSSALWQPGVTPAADDEKKPAGLWVPD